MAKKEDMTDINKISVGDKLFFYPGGRPTPGQRELTVIGVHVASHTVRVKELEPKTWYPFESFVRALGLYHCNRCDRTLYVAQQSGSPLHCLTCGERAKFLCLGYNKSLLGRWIEY